MTGLVAALLAAAPARAVVVGNCGAEPASVLANIGGEIEEFTLSPGERRRILSPTVRLQAGERAPVTARYYEHYCIWHGKLAIQRKGLMNRHR